MDKYLSIWLNMSPNTWYTAKELNVASASMTAMVRRNMVEATETSPKKYRRVVSTTTVLAFLLEKFKSQYQSYIGIYRGEGVGMLCSVKNSKVYDCYDREYDITNATTVRIGNKYYSLITGQEEGERYV